MAHNPNADGRMEAEGEFTLYDIFWDKLEEKIGSASFEKVISSLKNIDQTLLEGIAFGEWHDVLNFDLSSRQVNKSVRVPKLGNIVIPISLDGTAQIRFDEATEPSFDLIHYQPIKINYEKLFLSNTAQSGKKLQLLIGKGDFEFPKEGRSGAGRIVLVHTTVTLATGEYYTSSVFDALNYSRVTLLCYCQVGSTPNGVEIQQSMDGTNWDYTTAYTAAGGTALAASVELVARYVRLRWRQAGPGGFPLRLALLARFTP